MSHIIICKLKEKLHLCEVHTVSNYFVSHCVSMIRQVLWQEEILNGTHIHFVLCCRQRRAELFAVE